MWAETRKRYLCRVHTVCVIYDDGDRRSGVYTVCVCVYDQVFTLCVLFMMMVTGDRVFTLCVCVCMTRCSHCVCL